MFISRTPAGIFWLQGCDYGESQAMPCLWPLHLSIPLDGRTLLDSTAQQNIQVMGNAQYCYLGLKYSILSNAQR